MTISGIGKRKSMQDFATEGYNATCGFRWFVLCDGIGGQPKGDVAARLTADVLHSYFSALDVPVEASNINTICENGLIRIGNAFEDSIEGGDGAANMGCTLCCLLMTPSSCYVLWAGDSRLFQIRRQKLVYENIPHTFIFDLYRKGDFTKEEAENGNLNYLTGAISEEVEYIRWELTELDIRENDRVIICTDGVWGSMEYADFVSLIEKCRLSDVKHHLDPFLKEYGDDNYWAYLVGF